MQDRRHFLQTGFSLAAAGLAGAAALTGARRTLAEEGPPETASVRLGQYPASCLAPLYIVDDLLREEGFADIRFVPLSQSLSESVVRGEVDFGQDFSAPIIVPIDGGAPIVMLGGVHPGCIELFARESIRSVVDLRGKRVGVAGMDDAGYVLASIIAASVGLDPAKDINWVFGRSAAFRGSSMARPRQSTTTASTGPRVQAELFAAGEIDAFLTFPPWAQELRARNFGRVIFNSSLDRPWSQYFCCMLIGASDFVRRNPIATKRVVRAMARATDICADKPDWVAQRLVDRDFTARYDSTRQGLDDVPYRDWREYDPEDAVRFYALRLHELGMIKSSPDTIIAKGADWRFVKEVRKELGI